MNKIAYVIPGFMEQTNSQEYQKIIQYFQEENITVKPIKISWKYNNMSNYIKEFMEQINHKKEDEVILFGFSFGAMITFLSAKNIKPKKIILCSLSPYFKEDLNFVKKSWKTIVGTKRINDFKQFSFREISNEIKSKTILLVGEKENKLVMKRIKEAKTKLKDSQLIIVPGASHNISNKNYLEAIKKVISLT